MGTIDRASRSLIAVVIAVLYFAGVISGTVAVVLGIIAVVFLATSFISFCPLYAPLKWSTAKKSDQTA